MPKEYKTIKPKVVLDTNVYVSALHFGGIPRKVLDLMWQGKIEVYVSKFILEEIERVLTAKIHWETMMVQRVIKNIKEQAIVVEPHKEISVIETSQNDNHILECGIEAKVDYIVSGDKKHILPLKKYEDILIVSPAEFLRIINANP